MTNFQETNLNKIRHSMEDAVALERRETELLYF